MAVPPSRRGPSPRRSGPSEPRPARLAEVDANTSVETVDDSRRTFYAHVLRLHRTALPWWLRAMYVEGAVLVGFVLYLADAASAWVMLALPLAIAAVVKVYDSVLTAQEDGPNIGADHVRIGQPTTRLTPKA